MNNHAVPTESEAIKHNIKDTHAVGFHLSPRHDYWVLVKSHLGSVCVCGCVFLSAYVYAYALTTLRSSRFFLSWIPVSLSVINPRPITPAVITEPPRYIQVQQCVGAASHKEVMNKSVPTIGGTLENITPRAHTLWQLIEGSPWAECSRDIIIKDPVLVSLYSPNVGFAAFVIIKGILHRECMQWCQP